MIEEHGIRKMLAAMMIQAVRDAKPMKPSNSKLKQEGLDKVRLMRYEEAVQWLEGDGTEPFSFHWTCQTLGVDAKKIRAKARKNRELLTGEGKNGQSKAHERSTCPIPRVRARKDHHGASA